MKFVDVPQKCKDCGKDLTLESNRFVFRDHYTHEITEYQCTDCEWDEEEEWRK